MKEMNWQTEVCHTAQRGNAATNNLPLARSLSHSPDRKSRKSKRMRKRKM